MSRPRPNILLVICDDLALGDLRCHGNPHVRTPNVDALHAGGRRFTGYRSGPLCTPARASLMTGRHHLRTGAIDTYLGRSTLRTDETTLAECLSSAGYATGLFGKWHLGDCHPCRPQDRGFDHVVWHRGGGIGQPGDVPGNRYMDPILDCAGQLRRFDGYCTDVFADEASAWIRNQDDRPWFAYVAPNCPHSPLELPDAWAEPYRVAGLDEATARVYAMVENIDAAVGRLLATVDQLGQTDNTLVIFTSDHGQCGSSWLDNAPRFNAELRGIKGTVYEGGVRVPCLLRWPAEVTPGDDARVASPMDWLPTLTNLADASPGEHELDGIDLLGEVDEDRALVLQWHRGDTPVRYRNYAVVAGGYKLTRPTENATDKLYRLPDEATDLAAEHPTTVRRMRDHYDTFFDDVDPATNAQLFDPVPISIGHERQRVVDLTWQDWRLYEAREEVWSIDNPGWWLVHVHSAEPVRIDITHPSIDTGTATMELRCGSWRWSRVVPKRLTYQTLEAVRLPLGVHRFEAYLDVDGQRVGVERVVVRIASVG